MMSLLKIFLAFAVVSVVAASNSTTGALSFAPSLQWQGIDGMWSTFDVEIGSPEQVVQLLPSTSAHGGSATFVIMPEACQNTTGIQNCTASRGNSFNSNESSTWGVEQLLHNGFYKMDLPAESQLGLANNAQYGFDSISFPCPEKPVMKNQLIGGLETDKFWIGSLGISPINFNCSDPSRLVPNFLRSLQSEGYIETLSWGYTAGAYYNSSQEFGSLTLGGYDTSRFDESTTATFPFSANVSRDLMVGVQSIIYDAFGSAPLLSGPVDVFIDSMVSQMWLPMDVCEQFEKAFNLTWNETLELYLIDEETHRNLVDLDPVFTFELGASSENTTSNNRTVEITIPYGAFDLNVSAPLVDQDDTRYFPLKRAVHASQYTLGRVFLQAAYISADFERREFNVSQAKFESGMEKNVVAIRALSSDGGAKPGKNNALSTGAYIGIAVGVIAGCVIFIGTLALCIGKRREQRKGNLVYKASDTWENEKSKSGYTSDSASYSELSANDIVVHEMQSDDDRRFELDPTGKGPPQVMPKAIRHANEAMVELP